MKLKLLPLVLILLLLQNACSITNGGIEAGNPDITGKKVTLTPEGTDAIFVVEFEDDSQALVTQIIENHYESAEVPYQFQDFLVNLEASFSNGNHIEIKISLDSQYDIVEVFFTLNGETINTDAEIETGPPVCFREENNAALQITNLICSRIVQCTQTLLCDECEANTLVVPGLGNQLGATGNASLADAAQEIDQGQLNVDPDQLALCLNDILILPCSVILENLGDPDNPDYNGVKAMLPKPACAAGLLQQPPKSSLH